MTERYGYMVALLFEILAEMRISDYRFPQSKHTFSSHQLMIMLILRQHESKSYRSFAEWLGIATVVTDALGIKTVPHYTTLQKTVGRIGERTFHDIIGRFIRRVNTDGIFAIDATGFESGHSGKYYDIRASIRHGFPKMSLCSDMKTQIVCAAVLQNHPVSHDIMHVPRLLSRIRRFTFISVLIFDKGYDAERVHVAVARLGIRALIPVRRMTDMVSRVQGRHRKRMFRHFDWDAYHQRSKAETVFSVIKRRFGDELLSRKKSNIRKEMLCRILAYNCHRMYEIREAWEAPEWAGIRKCLWKDLALLRKASRYPTYLAIWGGWQRGIRQLGILLAGQ